MLTDPEISVKVSAYKEVPKALKISHYGVPSGARLCSRLSIPLFPVAYCSYVNPIKVFQNTIALRRRYP